VVIVETAVQCVGHPAARNAVISFGGPDALSQRDAVRIFEEAFGKPFTDGGARGGARSTMEIRGRSRDRSRR
jgi:uncharacterized protein YbjT (DUF2867 family)